jgi:hypothetical protein
MVEAPQIVHCRVGVIPGGLESGLLVLAGRILGQQFNGKQEGNPQGCT